METFFADLHIHIGSTKSGKPVKITGSRNLTLPAILSYATQQKGLDIIGIIDCHSPEVLEEIIELLDTGYLRELPGGGFRYKNKLTLIPGSELEIYDSSCKGPIHVLVYLPSLDKMNTFSEWLKGYVKNIQLSSQRVYIDGKSLQRKVKELNGLFIPAHVFTPFKSLFGKGVEKTLQEVFDPHLIDGIELGLSANTLMADSIEELHQYPYLTNSDAHSLQKMAREYQQLLLQEASFEEFRKALKKAGGRKIIENYGLNPYLGKYYETTCSSCFKVVDDKTRYCSACDHTKSTRGVKHRINELAGSKEPPTRPPYIPQVPLDYLPGLGPKTMEKLVAQLGTEMNILHDVSQDELEKVVPKPLAELIVKARTGGLILQAGGGGKYGKVVKE
ncbi:uncharacterized protein (TIGR00375 family) [Bacillus pakistanensis]|uniref:Uncharacterized protein (TIGR00375 family) n=1 Tax=Rossellomorea pakistanensis TaxID=992288 RepID=A0ABS2N9A5_9BACI|nr:endonuclease Q family protein [Bacillus pakistanensis]MBM7584427.1 uncharacterized protein (TIGR00375 family) [Bacillus pakistanensis]